MADLLRPLAGPRFCPWCSAQSCDSLGDKISDRLPMRVISLLLRYDWLVGRIGVPLHGWLHEAGGAA